MLSLRASQAKIVTSAITFTGLALAFYFGYIRLLPLRLQQFDGWQVGDWLLDYSGGLVRRGLFGEIIFTFVSDGQAAVETVIVMQVVLAALLYGIVGVLYWRTDRGPAWMMLVLSPAFLLFPALSPASNTRKELIVLAALGIAVIAHRSARTELGLWAALPLFVLGIYSHEALAVTLPAFVYLAFVFLPRRRAWPPMAAYAGVTTGALALALARPGDTRTATRICTSWNERGLEDCTGGALASIGMPLADMVNALYSDLFPNYWAYLVPVALATLPFFALRFWPGQRTISIIVVLAATPLFIIAWDYGRWIFLIVAQLSMLALAQPLRMKPVRIPLYVALVFILVWGFQHFAQPVTPGLGLQWLSHLVAEVRLPGV